MNDEKIKRTLLTALREAGTLIRDAIDKKKNIREKAPLSLVTETDYACDKRIVEIIRCEFPDHAFLTEESPPQGRSASRWIIDPIDGTTNFAHGFPVCCVSIGYEENGVLQAGGVYDPFRNELFFAQRGKGSTLNDRPITVSQTRFLSESLLATGFPYDRCQRIDHYLAQSRVFMTEVQGIRRAGAAALDLCYVASGRFDAYWEEKLNAWDKAAGMLIVAEAGGKVTDFKGNPLTLDSGSNLATNGLIHEAMVEKLKGFV